MPSLKMTWRLNSRHNLAFRRRMAGVQETFSMTRKGQAWVATAVTLAQRMPQNWFGQQLAQVMRKLVMGFADLPIRCEVDGLQF